MIYSRTCKNSDYYDLGIDEIIREYLITEKRYENYKHSRYKFWEYAITLKLIKELKVSKVVDITLHKSDNCYDLLLKNRNIQLVQYTLDEFIALNIRENRFQFLTCFGVLDYVPKPDRIANKMSRHLEIDGVMLITNEDNISKTLRKSHITPEYFLQFSLMLENEGFDIYPTNTIDRIDYEEYSNKLSSFVLQRIGK